MRVRVRVFCRKISQLLHSRNKRNVSLSALVCLSSFIPRIALLCLDPLERQEYTIALKLVPDLVNKETRIIDFLRTENFNAVNAAKRLCLYWKHRFKICGDRWLFPMNLTGSGALSPSDVALLQTGFQIVFQRDPEDGLLVLLDESRVGRSMKLDERASTRIAFYYGTIFTDEVTQLHGATLVHIVNAAGPQPTRDDFAEGRRMICTGLPMRFKQILVTRGHSLNGKGEDIEAVKNLMENTAMAVQFNYIQLPRVVMAASPEATLKLLESAGCRKALLPPCIGGEFDYAQLTDWVGMRFALENAMSGGSDASLSTCIADKVVSAAATAAALAQPRQPEAIAKQPQHGKQEREMPSPPVSPPKERQSPPIAPASVPAIRTNSKSGKPKIDETATPKTGETLSTEEIRKRNALYSRRTYHKRKMELSSLEEQVKLLEPRNKALREENLRLERLVHDAKRLFGSFGGSNFGVK